MSSYLNRVQAGEVLGKALSDELGVLDNPLVLALPRGGVPVAKEVARALGANLDVIVVRKLGVPSDPEYAFGAISINGAKFINKEITSRAHLTDEIIDQIIQDETKELDRREKIYRANREALRLSGRIVILVDDGIATGATMRAALTAVRAMKPAKVFIAVPVASAYSALEFKVEVDKFTCPLYPDNFEGVGQWYGDFSQVEDAEVLRLLSQSSSE